MVDGTASMRVLIVDDERSLLMTLAANLELEGFEVVEASGGERALELMVGQRFDLVLSDIRMPGMNGVELFRRIRRIDPGMPVVLMTAFALETLIDEALGEGAFAVLPKPFAMEHVTAALARAGRRPIVLIMDAETAEADATARALRGAGLATEAAIDEQAALRVLGDRSVDVCVIALGGDHGPDLVGRLAERDPSLAFIAVLGQSIPEAVRRVAALSAFACVRAPCDTRELVRVIAKARGRAPAITHTRGLD